MIDPSPHWEFTARYSLTKRYGHVRLFPGRVLGQWFCLDRQTGRRIWERWYFRPNAVVGVSEGVVVAGGESGVYGIDLDTGRLLWTSHGAGLWGTFLRLLDFLPCFENELADTPLRVEGGECLCQSGRVVDVRTGRTLRRLARDEARRTGRAALLPDVRLGDDTRLSFVSGDGPNHRVRGKLRLRLLRDDGSVGWEFDIASTGRHLQSYRYAPPSEAGRPFVYFVVSDEPNTSPHPTRRHYVLPHRTFYRLLTLDVGSGEVVQDIPLGEADRECRIEDVDATGLLVSADAKRLRYFERTPG